MIRRSSVSSVSTLVCVLIVLLVAVTPARAQLPAPPPDPAAAASSAQQAPPDDDDGRLDPIEPDFSIINLPTTLRLPRGAGDFHLTHRFNLNLICGDAEGECFKTRAGGLLGLDS